MKSSMRLVAATLLGIASSGSLFAGNATFSFDIDPTTDPGLVGALIVGNHNYTGTFGPQIWSSGAGAGIDGNPATGGYLSISDATNGNNGLAFVFPDIDNGLPLNGFQIDLDLRVGNGTLGRPADGFSISFARAGDVALVNLTTAPAPPLHPTACCFGIRPFRPTDGASLWKCSPGRRSMRSRTRNSPPPTIGPTSGCSRWNEPAAMEALDN